MSRRGSSVARPGRQDLDDPELRTAMTEGRDEVEAVSGRRLTMIAYPHGKAEVRVAEARSAGYELAFTGSPTCVESSTDRLMIGRVEVSPAPASNFVRMIAATLGGDRT